MSQLNAIAVTGFVALFPGSPTQRLNQLSYVPTLNLKSDRPRGSGGSSDETQLVSGWPGAAHMWWCPGGKVVN